MAARFVHRTNVRFAHVDAAGIVFYPRFFEMLNAAVEDWFAEAFGRSFATLHLTDRIGTPTVSLQCDFVHPAMLGQALEVMLEPENVSARSCTLAFRIAAEGTLCLTGKVVLVCMDLDRKAARPWPAPIHQAMIVAARSDSDDRVP